MRKEQALTSKNGIKMVIAKDVFGEYAVFTDEEWVHGAGYRYPEYEGMSNEKEAVSQAQNY